MFQIHDRAAASRQAQLQRALTKLPAAHQRAQLAAIEHLHRRAMDAVTTAGLDPSGVVIGRDRSVPYVGIGFNEAGDALANHEFGTPDVPPNPVVRRALTDAVPDAETVYCNVLDQEMR